VQQFERWSLDALEGWVGAGAYGDALACDKRKKEQEEGVNAAVVGGMLTLMLRGKEGAAYTNNFGTATYQ
jgi:hypothetical protein